MLKKTVAILNLAVSGFASAGTMGSAPACIPMNVTVPCSPRSWDIGVQALYLKPTYTAERGYDFDPNGQIPNVNPKWGWAYRIEGSYHFLTGNDLTMTFIHYDNSTSRGIFSEITPYAITNLPLLAHIENRFDQVNLVLGQYTHMGMRKGVRFYGGLQFAKIRVDSRNNFTVVPPPLAERDVTSLRHYRNTDFDGIGPVIGTDYKYYLTHGLSLTGNAAFSLLYGTSRYAEGFIFGPTGLITYPANHTQKAVVPSVEAKLGLKYGCEWKQGFLNLEGGYQAINYFNVLETNSGGVFTNLHSSNFGLYGPYFGAKWIGYL